MHVSTSRIEDNEMAGNMQYEPTNVQLNQEDSSEASLHNPSYLDHELPTNETMEVENELDREPCISIEAENLKDYETNATTDTNTNGLVVHAMIVSDETNGPPSNATEAANESELLDNNITEEAIENLRQN